MWPSACRRVSVTVKLCIQLSAIDITRRRSTQYLSRNNIFFVMNVAKRCFVKPPEINEAIQNCELIYICTAHIDVCIYTIRVTENIYVIIIIYRNICISVYIYIIYIYLQMTVHIVDARRECAVCAYVHYYYFEFAFVERNRFFFL